jgi:molecular chaperone HtpG
MSEGREPVREARASMPVPHIGAFVLETLTLGMYGEPRHTLREYVQNSFDAIRAAQRTKFLSSRGKVESIITAESIVIHDNGLGVPSAQAWNTRLEEGSAARCRISRHWTAGGHGLL